MRRAIRYCRYPIFRAAAAEQEHTRTARMMRATVEDAIDDLRKKSGNAAMIRGIV
jgi:hypothetical protein